MKRSVKQEKSNTTITEYVGFVQASFADIQADYAKLSDILRCPIRVFSNDSRCIF